MWSEKQSVRGFVMYVSLLFSDWCSNLFSPCTGIFSTHALMIHPVSDTILPSVMCNWSLVLCLVGGLYLLWFSWFFYYFFFERYMLSTQEATARAWHLLMCRDLSQFCVPAKAPSRVPLGKAAAEQNLTLWWRLCNAKEQKCDPWFIHSFT